MAGSDPVAVVGTRRPSAYGLDVARALGRGLAAAGLTVVSGMAHGIDAAAHEGALAAGGSTVAVLAGSAEPVLSRLEPLASRAGSWPAEPCCPSCRPGTSVWRWMFPARNRIIAALATMIVVVEAGERSGALLTAVLGQPPGGRGGRRARPHHLIPGDWATSAPEGRSPPYPGRAGRARCPLRRRSARTSAPTSELPSIPSSSAGWTPSPRATTRRPR